MNYRLFRQRMGAVPTSGNIDGRFLYPEYKWTTLVFKAKSAKHAMNKARKFWEFAEFGMGSFIVIKEMPDNPFPKGLILSEEEAIRKANEL